MRAIGGFVVTYHRSAILKETIRKIFDQTVHLSKLFIMDNSEDYLTETMILELEDDRLFYYRMGFNAGPAGAAKKGLELCGNDGFDWIFWGDDNDPPFRSDCFERLLAIQYVSPYVGVIGSVGQFFDKKKGVIKRVKTRLLEKKKTIEVDYVAGGMCMLVKGEIAREGILPDPDLFFGFEELDFCLKVQRKGYVILVDSGLFLEARNATGRLEYELPIYYKKQNLIREYYSLRNLLFISSNLKLIEMNRWLHLKWIGKALYGFRYGFRYGLKNSQLIFLAIYHYWTGVKGKTIDL